MTPEDGSARNGPDGQPPEGQASTAWQDEGSVVERGKSVPTDGNGVDHEASEQAGRAAAAGPRQTRYGRPVDSLGDGPGGGWRQPAGGSGTQAVDIQQPRAEDIDPKAARSAERQVALLFLTSAAAAVAFAVVFFVYPWEFRLDNSPNSYYTPILGILLGVALCAIGAGAVLWAKKLMPDEEAVQEREPFHSEPEIRAATAADLTRGLDEAGLPRRKLILGTLGLSGAALALPAVVPLASLGPSPKRELYTTPFTAGSRLVRLDATPVRLGDLKVGGIETVFPEGHTHAADAATVLIRLRPDEVRPAAGRENWTVDGHVAYSKICTHAGCPVGLYEQQTHNLLCPCHQSLFDVLQSCKPTFGPAARPLPQLAIALDPDGYFIAQGDYSEPVGPSFWERG